MEFYLTHPELEVIVNGSRFLSPFGKIHHKNACIEGLPTHVKFLFMSVTEFIKLELHEYFLHSVKANIPVLHLQKSEAEIVTYLCWKISDVLEAKKLL